MITVYLGSVFVLIELILMAINQKTTRNKRRLIPVLLLVIEMKVIITVTLTILVSLRSVKVMGMINSR